MSDDTPEIKFTAPHLSAGEIRRLLFEPWRQRGNLAPLPATITASCTVSDVQRLRLEPGDALVVKMPERRVSYDAARAIREGVGGLLREHLGYVVPIIVAPAGVDIEALRPAPPADVTAMQRRIEELEGRLAKVERFRP